MRNDRVHYDQVIVGAGISGLTLAHHLADVLAPEQRILLLDKDDDPDYNISFWLDGEAPFAPIMAGSWRRIELRHGQRRTVCPLERYALHAFWRDDFDAYLHAELGAHPNVDLLEAEVLAVEDHGDHAEIETLAAAGGYLLSFPGEDADDQDILALDPAGGGWTVAGAFGLSRRYYSVTGSGDALYVHGGYAAGDATREGLRGAVDAEGRLSLGCTP